ncbi:MAG: hypothetical protein EBZ44_04770 [Verrucomicrobia bacterium]|nr:hypothetical protein [Verrucomicrobiota bacterium]
MLFLAPEAEAKVILLEANPGVPVSASTTASANRWAARRLSPEKLLSTTAAPPALGVARPERPDGVIEPESTKEAESAGTTRQTPERLRSSVKTLVTVGPSEPPIGSMATSILRVCSMTMTGAAVWD